MVAIKKNLTTVNYNAADRVKGGTIKYLVVHYTSNDGDTAKGNTDYFKSVNRSASAHYFVDENEIYQCVKDKDIAWHCGALSYKHDKCRNVNSIGIELCSRKDAKGNYYFKDGTVQNAVDLVKSLMGKYNIGINYVLRHHDVTGKICPAPYCNSMANDKAWAAFKERLVGKNAKTKAKCRMYKKASTLEGKLHVIPKGSVVKHIKDDGSGWSYVEHSGIRGYVKNTCIDGVGSLSKYKTAVVRKAVYLRSARKMGKSTRIQKLKVGTKVKVICIGKSGKWAQVKVDGKTGFVVTSKIKR